MDQLNPQLARPAQADFTVIVWEDERNGEKDIYAQMIDNASGLPLWKPYDGVPVCTAVGVQRNPVAGHDSLGGVIIAWEDYRTSSPAPVTIHTVSEIYAHRLLLGDGSCDPVWDPTPGGIAITTNTNAIARDVRIAGTPDGAFITWTDYRNSSGYPLYTNKDVYLQYILSQTATWPAGGSWVANGINVAAPPETYDQEHPDIVLDFARRNNKYGVLVVYEDNRTGPLQIRADNIDATGANVHGSDLPVDQYNAAQRAPRIVSTGSWTTQPLYGALVTWEDDRGIRLSTGTDIYARRIDETFIPAWFNGVPVCSAPSTQQRPRPVARGTFGAVAWEDLRNMATTQTDVYVNVLDMITGAVVWPATIAFPLCTYAADQLKPEIDLDLPNDMAYVCWEDQRNNPVDAWDVYAQGFSMAYPSSLRWMVDGIAVTKAEEAQLLPQIAGKVVVWQDARRDPIYNDTRDDENIYSELLGEECDEPTEMHWKDVYVKHTQGTAFHNARFVVDTAGSRYAVWEEIRPDEGGEMGIYVQKLDRYGVPRWDNNGVRVSDPGMIAETPDICVDDMGGAYVCWKQNGQDIMLARVDANALVAAGPNLVAQGSEPRIVEDDAMNVILGYIDATLNQVTMNSYSSILAPLGPASSQGKALSAYGLQATKDREGGAWFAWFDWDQLSSRWDIAIVGFWGPGPSFSANWITAAWIPPATAPLSFSEFDIVTDVLPSGLAGPKLFPGIPQNDRQFDLLLSFTGRTQSSGKQDVYLLRIYENGKTPTPIAPINLTNLTAGNEVWVYHPRIAVDSIANAFNQGAGLAELGGAIVAWAREYRDPISLLRMCDVEARRGYWTGSLSALTRIAHWAAPLSLDQGIGFAPELDIATLFSTPGGGYLGRGIVAWETDQTLLCAPNPVALSVQLVDFGLPTATNAALWGANGRAVSPNLNPASQTVPILQTACTMPKDSFVPLFWSDDRSGSPCLVSTSLYDDTDGINHDMGLQRRSETAGADQQPSTIRIGSISPQPYVLTGARPLSISVSGSDAAATLDLVDMSGRRVARLHDGMLSRNEMTLTWTPPASLPAGSYLLDLRSGERHVSRTLIIMR
ncbi:MAG: hypothetical protein C0600_11265 [Ignavibacteria bacterium]|nr:MAG: hypothetical protein C0600_11265 [Ignavibacteria bacterium]